MRKVLLSGVVAFVGLTAPAASVLTTAAAPPTAAAAAPTHPAAPGLYHVPIIGKVVLPVVGNLLGGLAHATPVQSANWSGYADNNDTYNSVASSWTEPAVNCANSGGGGLLGGLGSLLGGVGAASSFWVGLDGYTSTSVEQLGTDSDCNSGTPSYYAWYEMYPNPSVQLPSQYGVNPGDKMTAWVASNANGTSFYLAMKDATAGWQFSTTQAGSGFARSSAEVVAEAPSSCNLLFCSEVPLADFGQVPFSNAALMNAGGKAGSLSAFNANQITMASNGTTLATPSALSPDGSAFSVTWDNS
jgi:hypothetical protein